MRVFEDTEDVLGEEFGDGESHAGEARHEEVDWLSKIELEGGTDALGCVRPGIVMVQPVEPLDM